MDILTKAFIKNLGKGRAWLCGDAFTQDLFKLFISPFADFKKYLSDMKFVHFTTKNLSENDIQNGEILFGTTHVADSLEARASNVEMSWRMLAGNSAFATLEYYLQKAGFELYIVENTEADVPNMGSGFVYGGTEYGDTKEGKKAQYGGHSAKVIGNGMLNIEGTTLEPAQFVNGASSFYIIGFFDPTDDEWDYITEIVMKFKPAHTVAICKVAERKVADNEWASTKLFNERIDGGNASTRVFKEWLNK